MRFQTVDENGLVYIKHQGVTKNAMDTIVVFDRDGKFVRSFGKEYYPGGHGIDVRKEEGEEFLYLCDRHHREVIKATLKGERIWTKSYPKEPGVYKDPAVKYSPTGSAVAVRLFGDRAAARELQSVIQIRDEGSGMDEEAQARAFEQFYRSETARRLAPDGSGVGLYAARGLVEAMDGTIEIASRLGGGTTVTLTLPAEPLEEEVARSDRVTKVQA